MVKRPSINQPAVGKNVVAVGAGARLDPVLQGNRYDMYKLMITWKSGAVEEMMVRAVVGWMVGGSVGWFLVG